MSELFPELAGLAGGKKQHWIESNLDLISMVQDAIGFDRACEIFHMKADTLSNALKRAEEHHRPMVTRADKAYNLAQVADGKASEALKELAIQAEVVAGTIEDVDQLKQNLTSYFKLNAELNRVMAGLCQSRRVYFTEHIGSAHKRKVGPTPLWNRGRLLVCSDRRSHQLPRPRVKNHSHRSHPKRRWRGV